MSELLRITQQKWHRQVTTIQYANDNNGDVPNATHLRLHIIIWLVRTLYMMYHWLYYNGVPSMLFPG